MVLHEHVRDSQTIFMISGHVPDMTLEFKMLELYKSRHINVGDIRITSLIEVWKRSTFHGQSACTKAYIMQVCTFKA